MSAFSLKLLFRHAERLRETSLRDLFEADGARDFLRCDVAGICIDASRQRLDQGAWEELLRFGSEVEETRAHLFAGEKVNATERRPALHPALRSARELGMMVDGIDVSAEGRRMRAQMQAFTQSCAERWKTVIHLGIGGSDLGPRMLCQAFPPAPGAPDVRFVSTMDPEEMQATLLGCAAQSTLFVVASKTFTTEETLRNFAAAQQWLADQGIDEVARREHFVAITAAVDRAKEAGIEPSNIFSFWEGVGGRYSVWSSVGLPVALHAGWEAFAQFLAGARAMDDHFQQAEPAANAPLMLALLMLWNHTVLGLPTRAVLPYNYRLRSLPRYLQQLLMESLGKGVGLDGAARSVAAPVVWGGSANDGAHAFFQFLHQGEQSVAVDMILARPVPSDERANALLAQCLAQLDLLASGRSIEEVEAADGVAAGHYAHPGDRPCTLLLLDDLSPETIGALLALYEHVTFAIAVLWGINPFDQFGVEYGKRLSLAVARALREPGEPAPGNTLGALLRQLQKP